MHRKEVQEHACYTQINQGNKYKTLRQDTLVSVVGFHLPSTLVQASARKPIGLVGIRFVLPVRAQTAWPAHQFSNPAPGGESMDSTPVQPSANIRGLVSRMKCNELTPESQPWLVM